MKDVLPDRDLVLIGAGHTNLHVVRMWRMKPIPDVRLTVVSPFGLATYSGMLPGTLAGLYDPDEMTIDLYRFCQSAGARLIVAEAVGLDPVKRRIELRGRPPIGYDVASVGIGSVPAAGDVWRDDPNVLSIKPMQTFRQRLLARLATIESGSAAVSITVVGAGAAGVEVSLCLDAFLRARNMNATLTLVAAGEEVLSGYADRTAHLARRELERRGVHLQFGQPAEGLADGRLTLADGGAIPADLVIWAVSAAPPAVLANFDLPKTDDGFLAVKTTLESTGRDDVYVVGDTATIVENPVPKAGVYAVREGPVLWNNLNRCFRGERPVAYEPQTGFLSLLATGDGRAIAEYKGFATHGRLAWKLKDYIDRKFMRKHQDYRPMDDSSDIGRRNKPSSSRDGDAQGQPKMRCRGCGGKVGSGVLNEALSRLEIPPSPHARRGLDRPDDAAILDPAAGAAEVVTVDFFQAFLDDPYIVGRVAALNAMSDVWAMGGLPFGALATVSLPEGPAGKQAELLYQLLAGALRELKTAGATLLGGHTIEGSDLTLGFTVLGGLDGREPMTKEMLQPGDRLILTKPLGTGVLLAGHAQAACRSEWMQAMLAHMLVSNEAAARVARDSGVCAATDVTGFGLAGHLLEMLDASIVSARLELAAVPLLDGFEELSGAGVRSSLDAANRVAADRIVAPHPGVSHSAARRVLFDPQTSGGMLLAASADAADGVVTRLREAGCTHAGVIAEVVRATGSPAIHIR